MLSFQVCISASGMQTSRFTMTNKHLEIPLPSKCVWVPQYLSLLLQCNFTPVETKQFIRDGGGGERELTSTSLFTQLQSSLSGSLVECCFTSTETIGLLRMGAQGSHLDFHPAPEL